MVFRYLTISCARSQEQVSRAASNKGCVILRHRRRLQVLQDQKVGGGSLQVLDVQTLLEQGPGGTHHREEVGPKGDLGLAGASADGAVVDRELLDELYDGRKLCVRDRLCGSCLFFQYFVEEKFEAVLEVGKVHAGPGNLPGVVAEVPANQLTEDGVEEEQTRSFERTVRHVGGQHAVGAK